MTTNTTMTPLSTGRDSRVECITAAVEATMARHQIPGMSLAISGPDGVLFAAGFGHADLATGARATESTQYLWFSLTKIATATAALRLFDTGKLDLNSPISAFVSGYHTRKGPSPTVRQLLNHTAGVANPIPVRWVRPAGQAAPEPREFLDTLLTGHGTPKYPIGSAARYSNLGYLILAEVIAQAAGQPFTQYVTDAVLRPLEMNHTGFAYQAGGDVAVGYVRAPKLATPVLRRVLPKGIVGERVGRYVSLNRFLVKGAGYGGLVGNVTDVARFAAMHLADGVFDGHAVLRPKTARMMRNISAPGKPFDVGLGWFRKPTDRNSTAVEHLGAGGGFYNAMRLYPDLGLGIVAMANTTSAYDHAALFETVARLDWRDVR